MDEIVKSLQGQAKVMEDDLKQWKHELSEHRDHFYELNYFTTPQLLSLREELGQFKGSNISSKPVKQEVMTLLQCISRQLSSDSVKNEVQTVNGILAEQFLHKQNSRSKPSQSYSSDNEPPVRIPSDNSNALSVGMDYNMPTPAAELYTETIEIGAASIPAGKLVAEVLKTSSGPQPTLTDEELTDKQKAIIANLREMCGFQRKLILFAFERCEKPDIEESVMTWCNDNNENFNFSDSDAGSDAATEIYDYNEDEEMQSEKEDTETNEAGHDEVITLNQSPTPYDPVNYSALQERPVRPLLTTAPSHSSSSQYFSPHLLVSHSAPKVKIIDREPISEDHPIVSALIDSGFSLKESFAAAEQYPDNLDRAMASLMEGPSESGELFAPAMYDDSVTIERQDSIGEYERQISADSDDQE